MGWVMVVVVFHEKTGKRLRVLWNLTKQKKFFRQPRRFWLPSQTEDLSMPVRLDWDDGAVTRWQTGGGGGKREFA